MFKNFANKRNWKQALLFYLVCTALIVIVLVVILSIIAVIYPEKSSEDLDTIAYWLNSIIFAISSSIISVIIGRAKKSNHIYWVIPVVCFIAVLAPLLSMIIPAYMLTLASVNTEEGSSSGTSMQLKNGYGKENQEALCKTVGEYVSSKLAPDESLSIVVTSLIQMPSLFVFALVGVFAAFSTKIVSIVLTNQRLVIVDSNISGGPDSLTFFPISDVHFTKLRRGIMSNTLQMKLGNKKYRFQLSKLGGFVDKLEELANKLPR